MKLEESLPNYISSCNPQNYLCFEMMFMKNICLQLYRTIYKLRYICTFHNKYHYKTKTCIDFNSLTSSLCLNWNMTTHLSLNTFLNKPRRPKINEKPYLRNWVYLYYLNGIKGAHYECICHNTTIKMKITRNTNFVEDENAYLEYALFDLLTHDFVNMQVAFN